MKLSFVLLIIILVMGISLYAQGADLSAVFSPSSIQVNSFNTASFDPVNPESQPILTTLTISNTSSDAFRFNLKISITWNSTELTYAEYISNELLYPGNPMVLSNRDLITTEASGYFNEIGVGGITLSDVIENNPVLSSAVMAGFFPDGAISLKIQLKKQNESSYGNPAVFTINVRNAGTVSLVSPGLAVGQPIQDINTRPVSYFWNAITTGFNDYFLTIREFAPNTPPTPSNVETMGSLFYQSNMPLEGTLFSDNLPYVEGNYYAWQIGTRLYNETDPRVRSGYNTQMLKSNWNVFRFVSAADAPPNTINELQVVLSSLGNPDMEALFEGGFVPVGVVQFEGRSYTGEEAINLVRALIGQNYTVEIRN